MSVLGSGNGTSYPNAVDTYVDETDEVTLARANIPNDLYRANVALQTEVGPNARGTKADVKTFLQTEHNTDGTHGAITTTTIATSSTTLVTNLNADKVDSYHAGHSSGQVPVSDGTVNANLNAEQHNGLKVKVVDIGDWNMDTTASISVNINVTTSKVRSIDIIIRNDSGDLEPLKYDNTDVWTYTMVAGDILLSLYRTTGGHFDTTSYDATSFNRGYITIWYIL
jgi:hypothetical protein